jgi:hypothetical protein
MRGSYKTRLLALASAAVGRKPPLLAPLIVYHSDLLPETPQARIDAAQAAGRTVVNVRFVCPDANGGAALMVDDVPPYVEWSRPEDAPMVNQYSIAPDGKTVDDVVVTRVPLVRDVTKGPIDNG